MKFFWSDVLPILSSIEMPKTTRCSGYTKKGIMCENRVRDGQAKCHRHRDQPEEIRQPNPISVIRVIPISAVGVLRDIYGIHYIDSDGDIIME